MVLWHSPRLKRQYRSISSAHELEGSTSAIVGTFAKLTVSQDFELRKVVRGAGGRYRVLKNKLAARASKGTKVEQALQGLKGVSSVAYTSGDPVALAKALSTWMQENAEFTFKLGIVDGQVITVEEVKQLATMPSKEQIFCQAAVPYQCPGTAPGHGHERRRPRSCRGDQPGSGARQICRRRRPAVGQAEAAPVAEAPKAEPVAAKHAVAEAAAVAAPSRRRSGRSSTRCRRGSSTGSRSRPRQNPSPPRPPKLRWRSRSRRQWRPRPRQPGPAKIRKQQRRLPKRRWKDKQLQEAEA